MPRTINTESRLITPAMAAKYIGIGEDYVRRLMNANAIPSVDVYRNKRDVRTTHESCDDWLKSLFHNPDFAPPLATTPHLAFADKSSYTPVNAKNRAKVGRPVRSSRKATLPDNKSKKNHRGKQL